MSNTVSKSSKTDQYQAPDYYQLDNLLTEEHILVRNAVRDWVKREVSPIIEQYAEEAKCPLHLFKQMGALGALGPSIPTKYGGGGMDEISYGLIMQELERGDSGIRSMASVQGSLVMYPIYKYGTEEHRQKYLPKLASAEMIGCFGLTEPDHGSNPAGMITNIKKDGDNYILNGAKMWI
ncbi:MAG: acyl-CoA dehydrogenase family protein, partial [Bacteroidetes bacterium]|nr:acyl-CoA dehydrogenase family protein [Bacteroidota bacterium]